MIGNSFLPNAQASSQADGQNTFTHTLRVNTKARKMLLSLQKLVAFLFLLPALLVSLNTVAQEAEAEESEAPEKEKNLRIVPLPVVASNPTMGFIYGVAPGFNWFMGDRETTSQSTALASLVHTTNDQLHFMFRSTSFLDGDKWNLMTDLRVLLTSQPTWGLGSGAQETRTPIVGSDFEISDRTYADPEQMLAFNYVRFWQTVLRRHEDSRLFYGVGLHLDFYSSIDDKLLDLESDPPAITHHYAHSQLKGFDPEGYTMNGLSANIIYDSRDNVANPYSGRYAFASFRGNPTFLGSDQSSSLLWLEYRDYFNLSQERPRHMIGVWSFASFLTSGEAPFLALPGSGWDMFGRASRPFTQGRFRGEDLAYLEVEYRFPLLRDNDLLGGVIFANTATTSSRTADINLFQYMNVAYGAGLRIMIDKVSRVNICMDYGWSPGSGAQGFFLGLNEVF